MSRARAAARAVADVTEGTIHAVVEIAAPPERVFQALTTPEDLVAWWGSPDTYQTTGWEAEVRVGGAWRSHGRGRDGAPFSVSGEYLEVDPPRRLAYSWRYGSSPDHVTIVRYQLDPIPDGTRLTVRHEGFAGHVESCESHTAGWERVLGWLDGYLAGATGAA